MLTPWKKSYDQPAAAAAAAAKSLQSCPTLWDPIDSSPEGSAIPGVLQAITLEWVAISFSNAWKWKVNVKLLSHVRFFMTPWTEAYQAPLSMGFFQARVLEWVAIAFSKIDIEASLYNASENTQAVTPIPLTLALKGTVIFVYYFTAIFHVELKHRS